MLRHTQPLYTVILSVCHRPLVPFLALLVLLLPAPGQGYERSRAFTPVEAGAFPEERLQSLLGAAVTAGLPGVSLRVKGPGIDFQDAAGVADLRNRESLTTSHAMYVASLGKTFTATVALQLCDEGLLSLEAPISAWLPEEATQRIPSSEVITLRHLLSHTSGLMDYMNDDKAWRSDFVRDPDRQWAHSDVVPYLYDKPLLFEPGTGYHYSNSNYILVGLIVERLSGQPFHTLIRKRIVTPLGLQNTFNGHEASTGDARARGYIRWRSRVIDTYPWYSHYGLADSGIHSTPADLALFLESLFSSGDLLSETMRTEMTTVSAAGHSPAGYGMGIFVQRQPRGAGRWYSHDGIDPGYQADMMYLPDLALTVVLAANASLGRASLHYEKLIDAVVGVALDAVRKGHR